MYVVGKKIKTSDQKTANDKSLGAAETTNKTVETKKGSEHNTKSKQFFIITSWKITLKYVVKWWFTKANMILSLHLQVEDWCMNFYIIWSFDI